MSLSSCESELYAPVSTGVEALGLQSGLRDFGNSTRVTVACDNQRGGGPHSTSRTWVGEARAPGTSFRCKQRGLKAG